MYYVYLLQSLINQKIYIGYTNDLKRRFKEHNNGESKSTRRYKPWKLIYYEAFSAKKDAMIRERKLKNHGKGLNELIKRLTSSLNTIGEG